MYAFMSSRFVKCLFYNLHFQKKKKRENFSKNCKKIMTIVITLFEKNKKELSFLK